MVTGRHPVLTKSQFDALKAKAGDKLPATFADWEYISRARKTAASARNHATEDVTISVAKLSDYCDDLNIELTTDVIFEFVRNVDDPS